MRKVHIWLLVLFLTITYSDSLVAQKSANVHSFPLSASQKTEQIRAGLNSVVVDSLFLSYYDLVEGPFAWTVDQDFNESSSAPPDSGFVIGPNIYGDRAKAISFVVPDSVAEWAVVEVGVFFSYLRPDISNETFEILIMNGSGDTGPMGTPLYSQTFALSDSAPDFYNHTANENDGAVTVLQLDQSVLTDREFFVVFDFASSEDDPGLFGLAASSEITGRVPEVWERWNDDSWNNMSDSWFDSAAGIYPWIDVLIISSVDVANENDLPQGISRFDIYPNPATSQTKFSLNFETSGHVQIDLFDSLGRIVQRVANEVRAPGVMIKDLEMDALSEGLYYARLVWKGNQHILPITLVK